MGYVYHNGTRRRVFEDRASSEVSSKHIRESQCEEKISSCRTRDDELNISRGVLATAAGGIVTKGQKRELHLYPG